MTQFTEIPLHYRVEKISIYLKASESAIPLEDYGGYLSDAQAYFHNITDFRLTIEDFYKIILSDSSKCFDIDGTKFP